MNSDDFRDSPAGRMVPTIQGCSAFVPNPLPPSNLDLGPLANLLSEANLALGELSGIGRTLPDPRLLIRPFSRAEAVASSRIEGTVTSVPDLLALELAPDTAQVSADTREVRNYGRALEYGLKRLLDLPVSKRLISELHEILLEGVAAGRGARFTPGEFKREQNWIGARSIQAARFVPPPPDASIDALDDLERFIHRDDENLPLLVKVAMIHYQFETIHPFPDGNGRVGRLIIPLLLCERKVLSQPLLYLSTFFESRYDEYIDLMFDVSRRGAWEPWIAFFLKGVQSASRSAIQKAQALQDLRRNYMEKIRKARSSALLAKVIDSLFAIPAITASHAANDLGVTYNSAKLNLQKLVALEILHAEKSDTRPQWYFAHEIMRIATVPDG